MISSKKLIYLKSRSTGRQMDEPVASTSSKYLRTDCDQRSININKPNTDIDIVDIDFDDFANENKRDKDKNRDRNKIKIEDKDDNDDSSENGNSEEYIVEMVSDKEVDERGIATYCVKWEGYGKNDNTWEPVQNLVGCDWALQNYQLTRANWLANKYGHKPSIELLKKLKSINPNSPLLSASFGRHVPTPDSDSPQPSNAQIANKRTNKNTKDKKQTEILLFPKSNMMGVSTKPKKEWRVIEILGMTEVDEQRYFLLSLENYDQKPFIRASLANKLFPNKVIDFYIKNFTWKRKPKPKPTCSSADSSGST